MISAAAEGTGAGHYQVRIHTGEHSFLMDEPVEAGGLATGPSPFDLLSSALAGCTLMTLQLYAARKGWAIDGLGVEVTHQKGEPGVKDRFETVLNLGDATDEQRERLLTIAQRCPAHLVLEHGADVPTSIAGEIVA